jgi:DNA-binding NarL/FixJ family response regulator
MKKYNFAIIEDNVNLRRTVSEYFAQSELLDCVMAIDSVEKFLKYHRDFFHIKLVLLDAVLDQQSSIYSIPHILQREPDAEIIMFTVIDDSNVIFQALTYGATGYLLKDITMPELERALFDVLEGNGALLSPAIAKTVIENFITRTNNVLNEDFTLKEKENIIMHLLTEGHTYEEISKRLGLSVNGIRYYIKAIYKKLQVKSRGELIRKKLTFKDISSPVFDTFFHQKLQVIEYE